MFWKILTIFLSFLKDKFKKKLNCFCHQANSIVSHTPSKSSYY